MPLLDKSIGWLTLISLEEVTLGNMIFSFKTKVRDSPRNEKPCSLKVRRHATRLIDLNEYLSSFPGATFDDKIYVTKTNEILLNSMPNIWS